MNIRQIVHESDTVVGRLFDKVVLALILISLVSMSLGTLPLTPAWSAGLEVLESVIVLLFVAEYILRIVTADKWWRYAGSFYGLVDLIALLPFLLTLVATGADLRAARALRMLRIIRLFKVAQYSKAVARLGKAVHYAREEALVFLFATLVLLYVAAMGIYHFEHEAQPDKFESVFHSLWWAVVTLTTVGYGDAYPITVGGRVFTFLILLLGMGIVSVPAGLIASGLSRAIEDERAAKAEADGSG